MTALGGVKSGVYARDWTESNRALWEALQLERRVYFIVLLLIIIMASFSIVTTLIMLVIEKRRDIAILRTMGASARSVGAIFFFQGAVIGALGTVLGVVLGVLGCLGLRWYGFPLNEEIFQMATVPVVMEPINFLVVGVSAFVICCVATIYPARRASALHPAELLRYE
jgi:lipoprotein-releasing system permease protein